MYIYLLAFYFVSTSLVIPSKIFLHRKHFQCEKVFTKYIYICCNNSGSCIKINDECYVLQLREGEILRAFKNLSPSSELVLTI